jgi:hypothetical protein
MLEVEDWTTNVPTARGKQRSNTGPPKPPPLITPSPHDILKNGSSLTTTRSRSPPALLPPPTHINTNDPDIAEGITAAPARPRNVTGTSSLAGPSGLSKLLAQANKDSEPSPPSDAGLVPPLSKPPSKLSPPKEQQIPVASSPTKSLPAAPTTTPASASTLTPFPSTEPLLPAPNLTSPAPLRLSPRNSPRPSPRQRPFSLHIAPGSTGSHASSPLAGVAITAKGTVKDAAGKAAGADTRRSSNSQVSRPSSVLRHNNSKLVGGRGVFALSTSPTKAVATTAVTITPDGVVVEEAEEIGKMQTSGSVSESERTPTATSREGGTAEDEDIIPSPAGSVTEGMLAGMNSVLWGMRASSSAATNTATNAAPKIDHNRRRTMSGMPYNDNFPSPSSTAAFNLNRLSMTSSTGSTPGGWFASLPWPRRKREREISEGSSATVSPARASSRVRSERVSEVGAGANTAADLLKRLENRD